MANIIQRKDQTSICCPHSYVIASKKKMKRIEFTLAITLIVLGAYIFIYL